jgi:hypothetical protein
MPKQPILPDVHPIRETCSDAIIVHKYQTIQCGGYRIGIDSQSNCGVEVKCDNPAVIRIRLATGNLYDLCGDHARDLGVEVG